jgi:hypothetical protein
MLINVVRQRFCFLLGQMTITLSQASILLVAFSLPALLGFKADLLALGLDSVQLDPLLY